MKEAIKQILKENAWEMEEDRYVIGLSNIDEIADEVVKLFLIPLVSGLVCVNCNNDTDMTIGGLCSQCRSDIDTKQTCH